MLLAKSCSKSFNIKNGTLKLGTLNEYRETELEQIADKEEGLITHRLIFEGQVKVPVNWYNTLCGGSMQLGRVPALRFPGKTKCRFEEFQLDSHDNEFALLTNSSVTIQREAPSCFIYCMSEVENRDECHEMFSQYDDYWYIDASRAEEFARSMADILLRKIIQDHKQGQYILPRETQLNKLKLRVRFGKVKYIDREIHINKNNQFLIEELVPQILESYFTKPPNPFQKEKEFRFHFTLTIDNNIVVPCVKSLILDSTDLQKFLL
jgi:hypothetical protein